MSTLSRVPRTGRSAGTAKQVVPNDWPSARNSRRVTGSHGGSARSGMPPPSPPPHEARTVASTIEGAIGLIGPGVSHRIVSLEPPPGIWPAWIATRNWSTSATGRASPTTRPPSSDGSWPSGGGSRTRATPTTPRPTWSSDAGRSPRRRSRRRSRRSWPGAARAPRPPSSAERLGGGLHTASLDQPALPAGPGDQLLDVDAEIDAALHQRPERHPQGPLRLHAGPEELELDDPAERGVLQQPAVRLQPAHLLQRPRHRGLHRAARDAEPLHQSFQRDPVLLDLAGQPGQVGLIGRAPVAA